jgi:hypothetical protein
VDLLARDLLFDDDAKFHRLYQSGYFARRIERFRPLN